MKLFSINVGKFAKSLKKNLDLLFLKFSKSTNIHNTTKAYDGQNQIFLVFSAKLIVICSNRQYFYNKFSFDASSYYFARINVDKTPIQTNCVRSWGLKAARKQDFRLCETNNIDAITSTKKSSEIFFHKLFTVRN